jgi:hypothetical protein
LHGADRSSKEVLPSLSIRLRNLLCEEAKVLTRTVESHDDDDDDDDDTYSVF